MPRLNRDIDLAIKAAMGAVGGGMMFAPDEAEAAPRFPKNWVRSFDDVVSDTPVSIRSWHGTSVPETIKTQGFKLPESGERNPLTETVQSKFKLRNELDKQGFLGRGVYYADSKSFADKWGTPIEIDVNLKKPFVIHSATIDDLRRLDLDALKKEGYDGIVVRRGKYGLGGESYRQGVAFDPSSAEVATIPFKPLRPVRGAEIINPQTGEKGEIRNITSLADTAKSFWKEQGQEFDSFLEVRWKGKKGISKPRTDYNVKNTDVDLAKILIPAGIVGGAAASAFAPDEAEAMSMKPLRDVITKGGGTAASVASKAEHPIFIRTKGVGEFDERYLYDLPNLKQAIETTDTASLLEAYRSGNVKRVVQRYDGTDYSSYHPDEDLRKAFLKQPEIIQKRLFDIARKNVKKEMGGRWDVSPIDKKVIDESGDALYFAMNLAELADNPKSFLTSTAGIDVIPPTKRIGPVFKSLAAPVAIGAAGAMMPFEVGAAERPVPMTATGIVGRMGPQAPLGMEMESRREYGRKWEGGGLKEAINPAEYLIPARWGGGAINMAVDALLNQILGE